MSAINFKEIPEAHLGGGMQDTFELFARDFLSHLGYKIEEDQRMVVKTSSLSNEGAALEGRLVFGGS